MLGYFVQHTCCINSLRRKIAGKGRYSTGLEPDRKTRDVFRQTVNADITELGVGVYKQDIVFAVVLVCNTAHVGKGYLFLSCLRQSWKGG